MKASFIVVLAGMVAALAWFAFVPRDASNLLIEDVTARPLHGGGLAVFLTVTNQGVPDRLIGVSSPDMAAELFAPDDTRDFPIPLGRASLAADAGYIRLPQAPADLPDGALLPLTLLFQTAGKVQVKARLSNAPDQGHVGMAMMHGMDTPEGPAPAVTLAVTPAAPDWRVDLTLTDFTFAEDQTDMAHVPGQGHGHLYIGAIKLGRISGDSYVIGALPSGSHVLRVVLNTNDHRPYMQGGLPVAASAVIVVD